MEDRHAVLAFNHEALVKHLINLAGSKIDLNRTDATVLASKLPLSHGLPTGTMKTLVDDPKGIGRKLLSPQQLSDLGIKPLDTEGAEACLGTKQFVFLYCGNFRYPKTQIGMLFSSESESIKSPSSEATPFDSGGLHRHFEWPDPRESASQFLSRHCLPVPSYRDYMSMHVAYRFEDAIDYLQPDGRPIRACPFGIRSKDGGDGPRIWMFEVRVADELEIGAHSLEALFYSTRIMGYPNFMKLLSEIDQKVHHEELKPQNEGDFRALQRQCIDYLKRKGMVL